MCYTAQLDTGGIFPFSYESIAQWEVTKPFPNFFRMSAAARPEVPVVAMENRSRFQTMRWLLVPPWVDSSDKLRGVKIWTANARIEDAETKKLYRPLIERQRCVVLFTGFYEWRHEKNGTKTRYFLTLPDDEPMLLPGFYRRGTIDGEAYASCTVCTMEARGIMRYIHNSTLRQPVVLRKTDIEPWLDPAVDFERARDETIAREASASFVPEPPVYDAPGLQDGAPQQDVGAQRDAAPDAAGLQDGAPQQGDLFD